MAKSKVVLEEKDYSSFIDRIHIAIVVSQFNSSVTDLLLEGTLQFLKKCGMTDNRIHIHKVPGAFEIPGLCAWICKAGKMDGIATLGAVIQGGTRHFDYVCTESARGIMDCNLKYSIPVSYGILTCQTEKQAFERAGGACGNKGIDAARAVLDMIQIKKETGV